MKQKDSFGFGKAIIIIGFQKIFKRKTANGN